MQFSEHGLYTLGHQENMLIIDAEGPFNDERGMIAIAVVITNSTYADIQQMQLQRIYGKFNIVFHVFSSINRAKI